MCCGGAKWKREEVPDHKFDFVDVREFTDNGFFMRLKYLFLYGVVLKSFLVYLSDIFTAITMLTTQEWSSQIYQKCQQLPGCVYVDYTTAKYIFFACILFGFLLLAYEAHKAKKIIASRDISFAFTNLMANKYYSLRSYDHFCFFDHIRDSTKTSDDFAFFVFFTFKSWKRLVLSDGPRQTINGFTVYALYLVKRDQGPWYDVAKYFAGNSLSTSALLVTTLFTLVVYVVSLLILIVAAICYVPLLFHIQGNLKEYCCHKVDKRISDVIKRRQKQRLADAARLAKKEAMGDYSHLKNKKGEFVAKPLPQPTLPNLSIEDEPTDVATFDGASAYTQDYKYYNEDSSHGQPLYDDENESMAHLASSAAPFARFASPVHQYQPSNHGNWNGPTGGHDIYETSDLYQGHAGHVLETQRRSPMPTQPSSGLAYEDDNGMYREPQGLHPSQSMTYYPSHGRGYDMDNQAPEGGYNVAYGGGYAM
ncbi:hypothetical protein AX14_002850 [Amanita brunnescens Koide BX004]|nr:hypothetical protein AX14_002850 [Amanita brunnescens Koide BX004]